MEELLRSVLRELSPREALQHAEYLSRLGERLAGTQAVKWAAEYIHDAMEGYGLEVELQRFKVYTSYPGEASLTVLAPIVKDIRCRGYAHIESTPPVGIETELVYVGTGREEDYDGLDVIDKIVLTDLRGGPARPERARIAVARGAVGMIVSDWGLLDHPVISNGAMKGVWGNPTPDTVRAIPRIVAVGVPREDGELLKQLLVERGTVKVRLRAHCRREWVEVEQPVGRIEGSVEPEKFVLIAGHFEAWGPGATDNAAGNGLMLELARVLAAHGGKLRRSIVFAFWNGHEIAEAAGSTWFVDNLWDEIRDGAVIHMNIDQPGLRGTEHFQVFSTPELERFVMETARKILEEEVIYAPLRGKHSDQSFYGAGVPSLLGGTVFPVEEIERMGGAPLGWWWHTEEDTLDKIDAEVLGKSMRVFAAYAVELCNTSPLPFEFSSSIRVVRKELEGLHREIRAHQVPIDLDPLISKAQRLERDAAKLEQLPREDTASIDRCLLRLSRWIIPALYVAGCRYRQDSYGLSDLEGALPISRLLRRLVRTPSSSADYEMFLTECVRRRNRITDLFGEAVKCLDDFLRTKGEET